MCLNIDATAATAGAGKHALVNGDIKYADNGYTTLTTVLGQAGHAGIAVEVGTADGANAANRYIAGSANNQAFDRDRWCLDYSG